MSSFHQAHPLPIKSTLHAWHIYANELLSRAGSWPINTLLILRRLLTVSWFHCGVGVTGPGLLFKEKEHTTEALSGRLLGGGGGWGGVDEKQVTCVFPVCVRLHVWCRLSSHLRGPQGSGGKWVDKTFKMSPCVFFFYYCWYTLWYTTQY